MALALCLIPPPAIPPAYLTVRCLQRQRFDSGIIYPVKKELQSWEGFTPPMLYVIEGGYTRLLSSILGEPCVLKPRLPLYTPAYIHLLAV